MYLFAAGCARRRAGYDLSGTASAEEVGSAVSHALWRVFLSLSFLALPLKIQSRRAAITPLAIVRIN